MQKLLPKIKVTPKYYFGYLQGFVVHINKQKFPAKRGYVYAHNNNNKAIKTAMKELEQCK